MDSQAALLALNNDHVKPKLVKETVDILNLLVSSGKNITLSWVKAHVGYLGNELADEAAKGGALSCDSVVIPCCTPNSASLKAK